MYKKINEPIVYRIEDNYKSLVDFEEDLKKTENEELQDIILNFPIVYIHNWMSTDKYDVYIGETNNIVQRTKQHYEVGRKKNNWQKNIDNKDSSLYVIGHELFNKSLTLDLENRLMTYMLSIENVRKIHNQRANPQNRYYTDEFLDDIFRRMWRKLRKNDPTLFPTERKIKDSAIFKASPLHKLHEGQVEAKEKIVSKVFETLKNGERNQLIFIEGEAGTGKTVLNSSTFYELFERAKEKNIENFTCSLLVNHKEQLLVYEQIAEKLGLNEAYGKVIDKPTIFINNHRQDSPVDVVFIDEAHLLLTQGKQSYTGKNQLKDIIDRARVTVVMFDENQVLTTEQFWESEILNSYKNEAIMKDNYIELKKQLRMDADKETIDWIDNFTKKQKISKIPKDSRGYEIRIFESPEDLDRIITNKAEEGNSSLSRIVATYDWEYSSSNKPDERMKKYWEVSIGKWNKPWNYELSKEMNKKEKKAIKSLSWAEQSHTINEVGSTFTIQGFDLNYVGVILGPSVKYRNGSIIFDPNESCNKKAVRNRTLLNGTQQKFGEILIRNEVRVLMTRGVKGLYIYAYDEELRKELINMN